MSIRQGGKVIAGNVSHYNIGDTFMTKRTDNTLNGAVECDGATYNTTDFTGDGSIGELLEAGKLDYVSLSAYSTAIAQTGWCDKIGWDGTETTSFRVPTITPGHYIIKSQEPTAENNYTWYKLYADGWVEQGGQFTATSVADGAGTAGNNTINLPITMANNRYWYSANIQVGASGWEYANGVILNERSTTTLTLKAIAGTGNIGLFWEVNGMSSITPQTNTRVMIQIANGATDQALETCTGVLADVADLKDLSNITADGKEVCAHQAMPSNRTTVLTAVTSGGQITAPADGYISARATPTGAGQFLELMCGVDTIIHAHIANQDVAVFIPVSKGAIVTTYYSTGTPTFTFVYANGAQ